MSVREATTVTGCCGSRTGNGLEVPLKGREMRGLPGILLLCMKSKGRLFPILNSRRKLVGVLTVIVLSDEPRRRGHPQFFTS